MAALDTLNGHCSARQTIEYVLLQHRGFTVVELDIEKIPNTAYGALSLPITLERI